MSKNPFDLLIDLSEDLPETAETTHPQPAPQASGAADPPQTSQTHPPTFLRRRVPKSAAHTDYIRPSRLRQKLTTPNFPTDPETRGREAFRKHDEPNRTFRLPINFNPLEASRSKNARNRVTSFPALEQISGLTQAHLVLRRAGGRDQILIWGSTTEVDHAVQLLKDWISSTLPPEQARDFAKIPSPTASQSKKLASKVKRDAVRQKYRCDPKPSDGFGHIVCLLWPEDTGWKVEEALGRKVEALDPIRMDSLCHIRYVSHLNVPDIGPCFQFMGNDLEKITKAVERVQNIELQIAARRYNYPSWHIIKPTKPTALRMDIVLKSYDATTTTSLAPTDDTSPGMTPSFSGKELDDADLMDRAFQFEAAEPDETYAGGVQAEALNLRTLGAITSTTLKILQGYRGPMQMRARLGCYVLNNYRKTPSGQMPLDEFEEMVNGANADENPMSGY
ncbi:hypothetical protein LTS18_007925, partial [Coniosporium uncinatum]